MNYGRLYGAIPGPEGTQFRVWAPSIEDAVVDKVELLLYNGSPDPDVIPMQRENASNWECYLPNITTGQRYNFRINGNREKLDPWARHVTHSDGISIVEAEDNYVWQCTNFQMPPFHELVIYQMHVRTYLDNDRGPANQLSAVTNDLWYLQKLGVNAIQLLPAAEFEGDDSWGYNPACIYAIESSYGGPTALKKMVDSAHARGIAVFLDVVYNHLSPRGSKGLYQFTPWHRHINLPGHKELETGGIYFYYDDRAHTDWMMWAGPISEDLKSAILFAKMS
jgi:1,4-alpha-glucan branching enzyme